MTDRPHKARREPTRRIIDLATATNLAMAGATYKQIASELDVDEETVRYHLLSPEGQRALRYAVNEIQERSDRFLASAHLQALRRLVREMEEAEKSGDRIRAAQAIVSLAAKRIEITGADGGAIQIDSTVAELLDDRISRMRERSRVIIDATSSEILPESEPEALLPTSEMLPEATDPPPPTQESDPSPAAPEKPLTVDERRRRGPAIVPAARLRAIR